MAKSTFSSPVVSNNGLYKLDLIIVDITAETTLTFNDHAGRISKSVSRWYSNTTINKVWRVRC